MSCEFQEINMYDEKICRHPNKGGDCYEYGCQYRTDNKPAYNSSTNQWEKIVDGTVVSIENPYIKQHENNMKKSSCKFCNFHSDDQELIFDGYHSGLNIEACLIPPSPISMRKNPDKPAQLQVVTEDEKHTFHKFEIPITYCPICGRKL